MRNKLRLKHLLLIGAISLTGAHATDDVVSAENFLTGMFTDPLSRNSQVYSDVLNRFRALPFDKVTDFMLAATRICSPDKPGHNLIILDGLIKLDSEVLSDDRYISIIQSLLDVTSCQSQRIFVFNILKVLQREQWEPFQKIASFLFGLRGSNEYYVNWTEIFNSIGLDTLCDPRFLSILQKLNEPRMGMCMGVLDASSAIQSIAEITLDGYDRFERDVLNRFSADCYNNMFSKVDLIKYLINFSPKILYDTRLIGVLNGVFSLRFAYLGIFHIFSVLAKMDPNKLFDPRFVPTLKLLLQQSYRSYNLLRNGTDYYDDDQLTARIISAIEALNDIEPEQWDEFQSTVNSLVRRNSSGKSVGVLTKALVRISPRQWRQFVNRMSLLIPEDVHEIYHAVQVDAFSRAKSEVLFDDRFGLVVQNLPQELSDPKYKHDAIKILGRLPLDTGNSAVAISLLVEVMKTIAWKYDRFDVMSILMNYPHERFADERVLYIVKKIPVSLGDSISLKHILEALTLSHNTNYNVNDARYNITAEQASAIIAKLKNYIDSLDFGNNNFHAFSICRYIAECLKQS